MQELIGIQENIPFESDEVDVVRFKSETEADMALEVNAGWIAQNSVKIGDSIVLDMNQD